MNLLVARHGNTFNAGETVRRVGSTDLPLVASGLQQGLALGAHLKHLQLIPTVIFTSELKRTQQTAQQIIQVLNKPIPLQPLAIFNEIHYGPDENQPESQVRERLGVATIEAWEKHALVPEGWSVEPKAIIQAWQDFAADICKRYVDQTVLVVTSNGIARFAPYLTGDFAEFSAKHAIKLATGALGLFRKEVEDEYWTCGFWNETPSLRA